MDNIIPSADLRNKYGEISAKCKESRCPIYITVNGRGDTVLLGLEDFNQMQAELELLRTLSEADDDVVNGRVGKMSDTFDALRANLTERK